MKKKEHLNSTVFKLVLVMLGIVLAGAFWMSALEGRQQVSLTVLPGAPRSGEPVMVQFSLNNPDAVDLATHYQLYANGALFREGTITIHPLSNQTYHYGFTSPVNLGEKISFDLVTSSALGNYEKQASLPPFPPQIASSFISFASFSTTVMNSMLTPACYMGDFTSSQEAYTYLVISVSLIILLISLELAGVYSKNRMGASFIPSGRLIVLQKFRYRFSTLSWILLIIFICLVYSKIVIYLSK